MNWKERHHPSWTGGVVVPKRKYCEATTRHRRGGCSNSNKTFEQPPRPRLVDASRLYLNVAATPPVQEGQRPLRSSVQIPDSLSQRATAVRPACTRPDDEVSLHHSVPEVTGPNIRSTSLFA